MDKIKEVLTRGVDKVYPSLEALEKVLRSGKKIRLYQGFDPTGDKLHLGHLTGLMKLRQFQQLGHEVIFLIGDGTGQAGDPSGKSKARETFYSKEELRKNAKDYVMQASKIVSFLGKNPAKIMYNSDWLNKLNLVDILNIAQNFTLQQLEERDLFEKRKEKGEAINMREFLYPLLQGYDSVAMKVDLEIGGKDQTFNMLCGRTLIKNYLKKEKFVLTTPLLTDASGNKIGKTEGNVIALTALPKDLYAMIMTLGDEIIIKGFEYLTDESMQDIEKIKMELKKGANPMIFKKKLAYKLTAMLNNNELADLAQREFKTVSQDKKYPKPTVILSQSAFNSNPTISQLMVTSGTVSSNSEAKRLIASGSVEVDNKVIIKNGPAIYDNYKGKIFKVGKNRFFEIKNEKKA